MYVFPSICVLTFYRYLFEKKNHAGLDILGRIALSAPASKQLELKMKLKKRPLPVLVIDHVDEKPTDDVVSAGVMFSPPITQSKPLAQSQAPLD
jgi:hypothetical protein